MSSIGFIGLGQMGSAIAERLHMPGTVLHVYDPVVANVTPFVARGAQSHPTARAVADRAETLFACLPSPTTSLTVAREIVGGASISTYVEMSTIGRPVIEEIAALLASSDIALIDAPVSGGPDGARAGRLAVMAAGSPEALAQVRPLLERIAGVLFEVGHVPGLGQAMKLVNNMIGASLIAVTAEAVAMGAKVGLDPELMVRVLNASAGQSSVTSGLIPNYVLNGRFNFGATITTMRKDIELGLIEAATAGAPMHVTAAVAERWKFSADLIGDDQDLTMFFHLAEQLASTQIRSRVWSERDHA